MREKEQRKLSLQQQVSDAIKYKRGATYRCLESYKGDVERVLKSEWPTIACDFDGTITYIKHPDGKVIDWPSIGEIRPNFVKCFHRARALGFHWSLNTLRHDEPLRYALDWLNLQGIHFDTVCDNHWYLNHKYGECRKIAGDFYFEDRTFPPLDMDMVWDCFSDFLDVYAEARALKYEVEGHKELIVKFEV